MNTAEALELVLKNPHHEYSYNDCNVFADVLVRGGHMEPGRDGAVTTVTALPSPSAAPVAEPAPTSPPAVVIPFPSQVVSDVNDANDADDTDKHPRSWEAAKNRDPGRDWGTYYVTVPASLVRAIGQKDRPGGRVGIRHVRLFAAINLHTEKGEGGVGIATIGQIARESGWAPRSIREAIGESSPLAEWAVKTGMTSKGRTVFDVHSLEEKEQWVRIPWWWLWDEIGWVCSRSITDKALLAALTLQRAVRKKNVQWVDGMAASMTVSSHSTQGLATLAGVDERIMKVGLREAYELGWVLNSNAGVDPDHWGGRSIKPVRTVVLHRTLPLVPAGVSS